MQATIDLEMEAKLMEHKKERELLGRRHMDRDNALRKVRKATQFLDSAQNQLPPLKASLYASKVDVAALKKVQSKTARSLVELKKDTDILINSFLKEEKKVRKLLEQQHVVCYCSYLSGVAGRFTASQVTTYTHPERQFSKTALMFAGWHTKRALQGQLRRGART